MRNSGVRRLTTLALGLLLPLSGVAGTLAVATPASAAAVVCGQTGGELYVTADSAPVRTTYYATGSVRDTVHRADRLNYTKWCDNSQGNRWYFVDLTVGVTDGWIYSGNVARI